MVEIPNRDEFLHDLTQEDIRELFWDVEKLRAEITNMQRKMDEFMKDREDEIFAKVSYAEDSFMELTDRMDKFERNFWMVVDTLDLLPADRPIR